MTDLRSLNISVARAQSERPYVILDYTRLDLDKCSLEDEDRMNRIRSETIELFLQSNRKKVNKSRLIIEAVLYVFTLIFYGMFVFELTNITRNWEIESSTTDYFLDEEFPNIKIYKNFFDIGQFDELWQWAIGPLAAGLGDPDDIYEKTHQQLGGVRVRTIRVKDSCEIYSRYEALYGNETKCYGEYSTVARSTEPYGPDGKWTFMNSLETGNSAIWGYYSTRYPGGGFVVDIDKGEDLAAVFEDMRDNGFTDRQTRAVFFYLTLYNTNIDTILDTCFFIEVSAAGTILPRAKFHFINASPMGYPFYLYATAFILLSTLSTIINYIVIRNEGFWKFLKDPVNFLDFLSLIFTWVGMVLFIMVEGIKRGYDPTSTKYIGLDYAGSLSAFMTNAFSFLTFLLVLKVFKFTKHFKMLNMIWRTLYIALPELATFSAFFFIIFFAFTMMGQTLFGPQLEGFQTFIRSGLTVVSMSIGNINFSDMRSVNRLLGPAYYFLFVFFIILVLINMFIAILENAYDEEAKETKREEKKQRNLLKAVLTGVNLDVNKIMGINKNGLLGAIQGDKETVQLEQNKRLKKLLADSDEVSVKALREEAGLSESAIQTLLQYRDTLLERIFTE